MEGSSTRLAVNNEILSGLLDDDYFSREPPKSTAREFFNLDYMYYKVGKKRFCPKNQKISKQHYLTLQR